MVEPRPHGWSKTNFETMGIVPGVLWLCPLFQIWFYSTRVDVVLLSVGIVKIENAMKIEIVVPLGYISYSK